MPVQLIFNIEGEQQLSRRLGFAEAKIKDFGEPLRESAMKIKMAARENMRMGGSRFGGWPPRKKPYPWPILRKSGTMYNAFADRTDRTQTEVYNPTSYFKYHQSNAPRSRLPRRVMLKLDEQLKSDIQKAFQKYIQSAVSGGAGGATL